MQTHHQKKPAQAQASITVDQLASILQQAGQEIISPAFQHAIHSTRKKDGSIVTETDLACQSFIEAELTKLDPSISFLGEEMSQPEQLKCLKNSDGKYWCLDPLDGTTNFAASLPSFAISLALIESGTPQLACIYDPVRQETFSATRHKGATLNGKAIHTSAQLELKESVGFIDFKRLEHNTAKHFACTPTYRSQRNLGTCALEWAWLAAGRGQFIIHGGEKLWDFAAGSLIATEAGASVGDFSAQALFPSQTLSSSVLSACNETIRKKLLAEINTSKQTS